MRKSKGMEVPKKYGGTRRSHPFLIRWLDGR